VVIALSIGIAIGWVGRGFVPCPSPTSPVSIPVPESAAYLNARFQFAVHYPAQLLYPQGEADNGDGQRFLSKDARTTLAAFGNNLALNGSLEAEFEEAARGGIGDHPLRVVTYKKLGNHWYVVSGVEQGMVFYTKRIQVGDQFIGFEFTYPESQRQTWDKVTSQINASFKSTQ